MKQRLVVRVIRTKRHILFKYGCNTLGDAALPAHVTTQLVAGAYRTAHRMSSAVGQFDPIWASIRPPGREPFVCFFFNTREARQQKEKGEPRLKGQTPHTTTRAHRRADGRTHKRTVGDC